MLRLTRSMADDQAKLILEGRLLRPWLGELQSEVAAMVAAGKPVGLDLSALTFVDEAGARQLLEYERQGVAISGSSEFLRGLLQLQRR